MKSIVNDGITTQLNKSLTEQSEVLGVKSVVVAQNTLGNYSNVLSDSRNRLKVSVPLTSFNELLITPVSNIFTGSFLYDRINDQKFITSTRLNGTVSVLDSICSCNITADAGSYSVVRSKRVIQYQPGTQNCCRFSAVFNMGVALSTQRAGFGNAQSEFSFGYDGVDFGVLRAYNGKVHCVLLTLTAPAAAPSLNATIILNSVVFIVPLTNAGSAGIPFTAFQIAQFGYTNWIARNIGNTVVFTYSGGVGPQTGTYSFSHASAVGTFSTLTTGQLQITDWVYEDNFNVNPALSKSVNKQLGNVYDITFSWLGYGEIIFSMFNPAIGEPEIVHRIEYSNTDSKPSVQIPNFPIQFTCGSLGSTTAMNLNTVSMAAFTYGSIPRLAGPNFTFSVLKSIPSATDTCIMAIKVRYVMNGIVINSSVILDTISVACEGTKSTQINLVLNPTTLSASSITNYSRWAYKDQFNSMTVVDNLASTYTGGKVIASYYLQKVGSIEKQYERSDFTLFRDDILLITAFSASTSDISANISWIEQF